MSYLKAMVKKREDDWLSSPVLAAACVNPIYIYSSNPEQQWALAKETRCERAVGIVIKKLLWGDLKAQSLALDGLDRYLNREGIYSADAARGPHAGAEVGGPCQLLATRRALEPRVRPDICLGGRSGAGLRVCQPVGV